MNVWATETEWRVLQIDAHGDIEEMAGFPSRTEAVAYLRKVPVNAGYLYTVEGQRDRYPDSYGVREWRQTGITRDAGGRLSSAQVRFMRRDVKWYQSGDQPGFHEAETSAQEG